MFSGSSSLIAAAFSVEASGTGTVTPAASPMPAEASRADGADHVLADEDGKAARLREIAEKLRRAIHLLVDAVPQFSRRPLPFGGRLGLQLRGFQRRLARAFGALEGQERRVRIDDGDAKRRVFLLLRI